MTRQDDVLIATKIEEHSMVGTDDMVHRDRGGLAGSRAYVPLPCYSHDIVAGIRALECWRAAGEGRWWEIYSSPVSEGKFTAGIRDPCEDNTWFGCGATPAAAVAAVLLVIANETAP